jgi:hypothetical protein
MGKWGAWYPTLAKDEKQSRSFGSPQAALPLTP